MALYFYTTEHLHSTASLGELCGHYDLALLIHMTNCCPWCWLPLWRAVFCVFIFLCFSGEQYLCFPV